VSLSKKKYEEEIEENIEVDTLSVKNKHTEWDHDEIN
jgi:hypothetical protein